jgi:hypothetical protein
MRASLTLMLVLALAIVPATSATAADAPATITERLDALLALDHSLGTATPGVPPKERSARIERMFDDRFAGEYAPERLARRSNDDVSDLFRAAWIRTFYGRDASILVQLRAAYAELERRGAAGRYHALTLHRALLQYRLFEEATALASAATLEISPLLAHRSPDADGSGPRIWVATTDDTLEERRLSLGPDIRLIVLAQPHCGFSRRAMAAITADPEATAAFARHAVVLIPPASGVDLQAIRRWNDTHPGLSMVLAHAESEWPGFDDWETPVFYFMENGGHTRTVVGWPDDRRLDMLMRLLRQAPAQSAEGDPPKNALTSSSDRVRANGGSESKNVRP